MRILCTHTRPLCIQIQSIQIQRVNRLSHDRTGKKVSPTIAENEKEKLKQRSCFVNIKAEQEKRHMRIYSYMLSKKMYKFWEAYIFTTD